MRHHLSHPFDDDKLKEECGIFGVIGVGDASNFVALGLHALQHRGQEAGGIVSYDANSGFNSARRFGYVRDNFTKADVMNTLPGPLAIGHVRPAEVSLALALVVYLHRRRNTVDVDEFRELRD